jgi:Tfp pilus assembly protein PilV
MSLVELMIALMVLAFGILAVGRMFPSAARSQVQDRLRIGANYYAQECLEQLTGRDWADPMLTNGRHPGGTAVDSLGNGHWLRFYEVSQMTGSLDNLKKVDVTIAYKGASLAPQTVTATTYVRR